MCGLEDPKVYWEITGLLAKLEKTEEALELCEKALSADPLNRETLMLKINLLVQMKRYGEARESLAKIPQGEKDNLMYLQLEADIETWSGNYAPAIAKYQELVKNIPKIGNSGPNILRSCPGQGSGTYCWMSYTGKQIKLR